LTVVQKDRDVIFGNAVSVGRGAAFERGMMWLASAHFAEAELLWEGGVVVERPEFEAEFSREEGKGAAMGSLWRVKSPFEAMRGEFGELDYRSHG
jgi:hypothetical protein